MSEERVCITKLTIFFNILQSYAMHTKRPEGARMARLPLLLTCLAVCSPVTLSKFSGPWFDDINKDFYARTATRPEMDWDWGDKFRGLEVGSFEVIDASINHPAQLAGLVRWAACNGPCTCTSPETPTPPLSRPRASYHPVIM
jgi:hypothetical protein